MSPPTTLPQFVYKILPSAPPNPLPEVFPLSDLDKNDGFIHLSTASQIPITADLFFADAPEIWVIKLPFAKFAAEIQWNVPVTDSRPHLYGKDFGKADIESVKVFERGTGKWSEALEGESWLV